MISLATGWPDPALYPVAELARIAAELFAEAGGDALSYLDPEGLPALREQIAARGRASGFAADAEEIVVTSGARQALDLVCRVLLRPDDVVAVEAPTFTGTLSSLQATGARLIGIPVDDDGLDVDALERVLARHEIKLCVLQSACQNPTGATSRPPGRPPRRARPGAFVLHPRRRRLCQRPLRRRRAAPPALVGPDPRDLRRLGLQDDGRRPPPRLDRRRRPGPGPAGRPQARQRLPHLEPDPAPRGPLPRQRWLRADAR